MKRKSLVASLLLLPWFQVSAQLTAEVTFQQDQFLSGEPIPAAVRIINRSGQTLKFGDEPDWLTFSVESRGGSVVRKLSEVPVLGEFTLESSQVATRRVDLEPSFTFTKPGRYKVVATVRIKEWKTQINSEPAEFDIIRGVRLWSREFGVPLPEGVTNQAPEVRKYTLQQANYLRNQLKLYLRLTDGDETKLLKVFPIGPMVSFSRPEPQLDKYSNLHVLFQNGARTFNYTMINPAGEILRRQTYEYVNSRPRLEVDAEGNLGVIGGVRRPAADDLPATGLSSVAPSSDAK